MPRRRRGSRWPVDRAERLQEVRDSLLAAAQAWAVLTADSSDRPALDSLAASTRVLATTVGPYARYGMPVVEACAQAGTHYADLTGEVLFVRCDRAGRRGRLGDRCPDRPRLRVRLDPVGPLGAAAGRRARRDDAGGLRDVRLVATLRGGFSGGTIDSMRAQLEAVQQDPARRRARRPARAEPRPVRRAVHPPAADAGPPARTPDGRWTAPFVMAPFNTRIVRRSNALQGWAYGRDFRYGEVMGCGRPAGAVTAAS